MTPESQERAAERPPLGPRPIFEPDGSDVQFTLMLGNHIPDTTRARIEAALAREFLPAAPSDAGGAEPTRIKHLARVALEECMYAEGQEPQDWIAAALTVCRAALSSPAVPAQPAQAVGGAWISVEDRKPEDGEPVLASNGVTLGVYAWHNDGDGWCWSQQKWCWNLADPDGLEWDDDYEITHWQPLPDLPAAIAQAAGSKEQTK